MKRSYVVTGGGRGVGRAVTERLVADEGTVVIIDNDSIALEWVDHHPAASRIVSVIGDASDEDLVDRAADLAEKAGMLSGWVNNAAIFRDASLHQASAHHVLELISLNFAPALVGCATAVRRFIAAGMGGAIVNMSSHQARRAVPGALPYVTAKAAIEGLTRALAVDYGRLGIRVNALALGSINTERYEALLRGHDPAEASRIENEMRSLHPLGRIGRSDEVAATVAYLLSEEASFINGATLPVDGGRSVLGGDPEARPYVDREISR